MSKFALTALGMVNALGVDRREIGARLLAGDLSRMRPTHLRTTGDEVLTGQVA